MFPDLIYKKIYNSALLNSRFALISHRKPDADTIGSAAAFAVFLRKLGKEFRFFCSDELPPSGRTLLISAGLGDMQDLFYNISSILDYKPDCAIAFDCADQKQAGFSGTGIREQLPFLINIDHHATNNNYGDINLVAPDASSDCEIIYQFFVKNKIPIAREAATCLFAGVFSDTSNFTNPATTDSALQTASSLLLGGARFRSAFQNFIRDKNVGSLRLWGVALGRLKFNDSEKIVSTLLRQDDFSGSGVSEDAVEGISNFLNGSLRARAIIVYRELADGMVKASIRSDGEFDASEYAKGFGGGGHKKAAGFTIKGAVKESEKGWEIRGA